MTSTDTERPREQTSDKRRFIRDTAMLTVMSYGQYLIGLVTLPFLARSLGVTGLGLAAVGTAGYFFGSVIGDGGIPLPLAARLVAAADDEATLRRRYARLRLTVVSLLIAGLALSWVFPSGTTVRIALLGLVAGGVSSLSDSWVLVARRQFGRAAAAEWSGRLVHLTILVGGISAVPDASWVPAALLAGGLTTTVLTRFMAPTPATGDAPTISTRAILALGGPAMSGRLLVTAYNQGASLLYVAVLSPAALGVFFAGDRVVRAAQGLSNPICVAAFSRLSRDQAGTAALGRRARRCALYAVAAAAVASALLALLAPTITHLLYGSEYAASADILRIQAMLLPFAIGSSMLTTTFFTIVGDTRAIFWTTATGLAATLTAMVVVHRTEALWTLAAGAVIAEAAAFAFAWWRTGRAISTAERVAPA
jgi:O-antigen/teichoic acid export membrane protein